MARQRGLSDQRPEFVSASEAAAILGVRTATIYAYASRGLLGGSSQGPGRKARYSRALVETLRVKAAARAGHAAVAAAALRWGEPVLDSAITRLTPRGPVYRGHRAIDLVGSTFESVAELLWQRRADWSALAPRVKSRGARPSLHTLLSIMAQLALSRPDTPTAVIRRLACASGKFEALAEKQPTIAGALGASLRGAVLALEDRQLVDAALVLIADHELNASTFAARVATSAGTRWPEAFIAAIATATGVRHAAACDGAERVWKMPVSRAKARLGQGAVLEGFEAGAYPDGDPRGDRLVSLVRPRLTARDDARLTELLSAAHDEGMFPSVDLGLVLLCHALRFPPGSASLVFVIGRTAGWLAHVEEQAASGDPIRPRARAISRG
ncbi:MAG: citrate synthase [Archangium sp.]|nr:citrate synthase [Archangium sp.]